MYETRSTCRSCESPALANVLSLGTTPLADRLLTEAQLQEPELMVPLSVAFCEDCSLMQILETVSPEVLYCQDYPYYSSFSPALLEHSRRNALNLIETRALNESSLVVEVASNDGYLLKNFAEYGIPVLGIDPAEGPARVAQQAGIETLCTFFNHDLARQLASKGSRADVILANNVLAHVPDQNNLVQGMRELLKDEGVVVIEVPYVRDLIDHCEFDTIYHEHHCYFSVTSVQRLFERNGLYLNDVEHLPIHGGSLRLYAGRSRQRSPAVHAYQAEEAAAGVDQLAYYRDFATRVDGIKHSLRRLLNDIKTEGKTIAAYGAAAKGSTMVNYAGIGANLVDFVVDRNVHKQGCYMPGVHIPIYAPERLLTEQPDYLLVLAWNFKDEIMRQQEEYRSRGGRFIIPIPHPEVV
jgi:SAM-dependent methyltransferase